MFAQPRHFLPEDLNCAGRLPFGHVTGHAQWNDAYLAALARKHNCRLATCDDGLVASLPEMTKLIPPFKSQAVEYRTAAPCGMAVLFLVNGGKGPQEIAAG